MTLNLAKLCLAILILYKREHLSEAITPATSVVINRNFVTDFFASFFTTGKPKKKAHHPTLRPTFSPSLAPSPLKDGKDESDSDETTVSEKPTSAKKVPSKKPVGLPPVASTTDDEDQKDATGTPVKAPVTKSSSAKPGKNTPKLLPTAAPVAPDLDTDKNTDGDESDSDESDSDEEATYFPSSLPTSPFVAPSAPDEDTDLPTASPKNVKPKKGKTNKPSEQPTIPSKGTLPEPAVPASPKDDADSDTDTDTEKNADGDADVVTDSPSSAPIQIAGGGHKDDSSIGGAENIDEEIKIEDSAALSGTKFYFYGFVFLVIFACTFFAMKR